MLATFDIIVIFPNYGQFGPILNPDSGHMVCKTYIFIKSNLLSYTTKNRTKKKKKKKKYLHEQN